MHQASLDFVTFMTKLVGVLIPLNGYQDGTHTEIQDGCHPDSYYVLLGIPKGLQSFQVQFLLRVECPSHQARVGLILVWCRNEGNQL